MCFKWNGEKNRKIIVWLNSWLHVEFTINLKLGSFEVIFMYAIK
jgi:hypothetical protein